MISLYKEMLALIKEYFLFVFFYEETKERDYQYQLALFRANCFKKWIMSCVTMEQLRTCENYTDTNMQWLPNRIVFELARTIETQMEFIKHRNEYLPRLSAQIGLKYRNGSMWSDPTIIIVIPDTEFDVE